MSSNVSDQSSAPQSPPPRLSQEDVADARARAQTTLPALLGRAWPIILANAAVPLLGLADTAIIGNTATTADLGAIALGALIFSFVYWSFGFLRMSTTGFVAAAAGADDNEELRAVLGRALCVALGLGFLIIIAQGPIAWVALEAFSASDQVERVTRGYFDLRIYGAPATLSLFVLMGVLIGLGLSKQLLVAQLFMNATNIALDLLFAGVYDMGAPGVAMGTAITEWLTLVLGLWLVVRALNARGRTPKFFVWPRIFEKEALLGMLSSNLDIMIRTLVLIASFSFFADQSARYGEVVLASNHILLQLVSFAAFFLDGYAFVVEALVGKAKGAKHALLFELAVRQTTKLALGTALVLAILLLFAGAWLVSLLTDIAEVRAATAPFLGLAALYIAVSFAAFQLDGVFIGLGATRPMRNAALQAIVIYFAAWWFLAPAYGVAGLWGAMIIYVIARAATLWRYYPALRGGLQSKG
jgi:MATE family multidrug resistance protein